MKMKTVKTRALRLLMSYAAFNEEEKHTKLNFGQEQASKIIMYLGNNFTPVFGKSVLNLTSFKKLLAMPWETTTQPDTYRYISRMLTMLDEKLPNDLWVFLIFNENYLDALYDILTHEYNTEEEHKRYIEYVLKKHNFKKQGLENVLNFIKSQRRRQYAKQGDAKFEAEYRKELDKIRQEVLNK